MDWSNPIVYELGLTIVAAVAFWIWQTRDLRRAARELKAKEEFDAQGSSSESAADDSP